MVALITARGGSTRLPGKNTKMFHGRPLLAWTIMQAWHCKHVEDVYVTTDSEDISRVAEEYKAKVLIREHHFESLAATSGYVPTAFALKRIVQTRPLADVLTLFCTSPLRKLGDLDRLCERYFELSKDMEVPGVGFAAPRYETFISRRLPSGMHQMVIADKTFSYMDLCGGSSVGAVKPFLAAVITLEDEKSWHEGLIVPIAGPQPYVEVEWWQCPEIDRPADFDLCEYLFGKYLLNDWEAAWHTS